MLFLNHVNLRRQPKNLVATKPGRCKNNETLRFAQGDRKKGFGNINNGNELRQVIAPLVLS